MAFKISDHHARYMRMSAQRLTCDATAPSITGMQVVKEVLGVQAQEEGAAYLSIHSRSSGLSAAGVKNELLIERSMVRSWFMRGTLHLVATEDIDWLLPLLAPTFVQGNRRRYEELGLNESALQKGVGVIKDALSAHGPMTRHELAPHLMRQGVNTEGQALIYLINRAAWEGVLCLGSQVEGRQAYVLLSDWIGRDLNDQSRGGYGLLAERFLNAYAPASQKDFASWSGLPGSKVKEAWAQLEGKLIELEYPGGNGYILSNQAALVDKPAPEFLGVFLLPKFDTYLLGYEDRKLALSPEHVKRVNAGGGILRPILLVNGFVQGIWKINQRRNSIVVEVDLFNELSLTELQLVDEQVKMIGQFFEKDAGIYLRLYK
jgi:hypothetical protein